MDKINHECSSLKTNVTELVDVNSSNSASQIFKLISVNFAKININERERTQRK